jgi:hypothetical protein
MAEACFPGYPDLWERIAEVIRASEQASRVEGRREALEEAAQLVENPLFVLLQDVAAAIRALGDTPQGEGDDNAD